MIPKICVYCQYMTKSGFGLRCYSRLCFFGWVPYTIHVFKNYFVTVFSVFSNKRYPNKSWISIEFCEQMIKYCSNFVFIIIYFINEEIFKFNSHVWCNQNLIKYVVFCFCFSLQLDLNKNTIYIDKNSNFIEFFFFFIGIQTLKILIKYIVF